jgi:hypothetical protein
VFKSQTDPVAQELLEEVRRLSKQVAALKGEHDAIADRRKLAEEAIGLRTEVEELKIQKSRREEESEWERKKGRGRGQDHRGGKRTSRTEVGSAPRRGGGGLCSRPLTNARAPTGRTAGAPITTAPSASSTRSSEKT